MDSISVVEAQRRGVPTSSGWLLPALVYLTLVFGVSWPLWFVAPKLGGVFWTVHFFHSQPHFQAADALIVFAGLIPGLAAFAIGRTCGWAQFPSPIRQLRLSSKTILLAPVALGAPVAIIVLKYVVQKPLGLGALGRVGVSGLAAYFFMNLLLAPLWEEIGWRGCLFVMLSKRFGFGPSAIGVGLIWGTWYFPLYWCIYRVSMRSYFISFATIVGLAVVLAGFYSIGENGLVLPILFHTSWTAAGLWMADINQHFDLSAVLVEFLAVWALAGIVWIPRPRRRPRTWRAQA